MIYSVRPGMNVISMERGNTAGGKTGWRARRQGGYLLLISLLTMLVLFILGMLSLQLTTSEHGHVARERASAEALCLAEAAADAGKAYLESLDNPPANGSTTYYPPSGYLTFPTGKCRATITTRSNPTDSSLGSYCFIVKGYGESSRDAHPNRSVITMLRPRSFSLYGYFEDTGLPNNWWVSGLSRFDGPFHTNGTLQIDWKKNAAPSEIIFTGTVTSHDDMVNWHGGGHPSSASDWKKVFLGGQSALSLGVPTIPFPSVADIQRNAAWGGISNFPTTTGVYLNSGNVNSAGIYITSGGQPVSITFSVPSSGSSVGDQVITIQHKVKSGSSWVDKTTEITVDLVVNTTALRTKTGSGNFSSPTMMSGVPNGVIYCAGGDITGLSGTLADSYVSQGTVVRANNWTLATDYSGSSQKKVTITNNLVYLHPPDFSKPASDPVNLTAPALGVIAYQINIANSCPTDLNLHGVYMGVGDPVDNNNKHLGSIRVLDIDSKRLRGQMYILGGTIVKTAAILGQYSQSTMQMLYGYHEHYSYDPRMADGPLRAYPKTNLYDVVSWQTQ